MCSPAKYTWPARLAPPRRRTTCTGPGLISAYEPSDHGLRSQALRITRPFHARSLAGAIARELGKRVARLRIDAVRPAATAALPPEKKLRMPAAPGLRARDFPRGLERAAQAVLAVARVPAQPEAVGELELQLRVAAHAELVDRAHLARAESRVAQVDDAQQREGQGEDHAIGDVLALGAVAQDRRRDSARRRAATAPRGGVRVSICRRPSAASLVHELVVAAADVIALVRFLVRREAIGGRARRAAPRR